MTVTRLVGGLTPGDGSDPRTFPAIFNAAADVIDATEGSAVALGSAVSVLEGLNPVQFGTVVPSDGQVLAYSTAVAGYDPVDVVVGPGDNLLFNGAMQVHQRGTSATGITSAGYYTADRWFINGAALGTWTQSVENDAPTGSGFRKSLKMLCTTAEASPASGAVWIVEQRLEGQDLQSIAKGTSSAQSLTISFWVKSNVTGVYVCNLADTDNTRSVSQAYTVSSSATWEKKTITFPADTTGAFDNDNANSLTVRFWLAAGSDNTSGTLNTTWESTVSANRAVGQTNLAAATNNYWQVTGVQLEVGPVETPFEFKPYGQELAECQRYFYRHAGGSPQAIANASAYSSTLVYGVCHFPVTMRIGPTLITSNASNHFQFVRSGSGVFASSLGIQELQPNAAVVFGTFGSSTVGASGWIITNNAAAFIDFSSEL
jgi:hypothetical protein